MKAMYGESYLMLIMSNVNHIALMVEVCKLVKVKENLFFIGASSKSLHTQMCLCEVVIYLRIIINILIIFIAFR